MLYKLVIINWKFSRRIENFKSKTVVKKDSEIEMVNYRPVSSLSEFSKILERIMHNRFISYLNKYNIIVNMQHGFLKEKSTNTAIANFLKDHIIGWELTVEIKI